MLFDLRGRGRRRTVQAVYLVLALILGGGLVLFGVGNGNGVGGLLNGIGGSGGSGQQSAFVSQQEKAAVRQTRLNPSDPSAWASLVKAHYASAQQGSNFNTTTSTYTANGKKVLTEATQAWGRYLKLVKKPDSDLAVIAARAYDATGDFKSEASAWEIVTAANPTVTTFYQDLALAAWQAGETNLGDLASAKAVSVAPKAQRFELKQQLKQLRTQATAAAATTATTTPGATATTTPGATATVTAPPTTSTPAAPSSKSSKSSNGAKSSKSSRSKHH
jgi:hypothetical protein